MIIFLISHPGDKETPTCGDDHKAACRSGLKFYTLTLSRYLDHEVVKCQNNFVIQNHLLSPAGKLPLLSLNPFPKQFA